MIVTKCIQKWSTIILVTFFVPNFEKKSKFIIMLVINEKVKHYNNNNNFFL